MWIPTNEQIEYFKLISQQPSLNDEYVKATLPLLLKFAEAKTKKTFDPETLPGGVELFLAYALGFFGSVKSGVKGKRMGTVSYTVDYSKIPQFILDFLDEFIDPDQDLNKKAGSVRFFAI